MNFSDNNKVFPWLAFGLCVVFYAALIAIGFDDIEEDAFIYFRFAENIAQGYGYVFNIGGERIEACSGLLWGCHSIGGKVGKIWGQRLCTPLNLPHFTPMRLGISD